MRPLLVSALILGAGFSAHAVFSAEKQWPYSDQASPSGAEQKTIVQAQISAPGHLAAAEKTASRGSSDPTQLPPSDLAGLRYFAQSGDTKRLKKEIERLQEIYPDWSPPEDLASLSIISDPELTHMWKVFAEGKYPELRRLIDERKAAEPGWTAPKDLLEKLSFAEARSRLINASHLQQYDTVIRIAAANADLLTCANVDIMWRLAEAFTKTGVDGRAKEAYFYILQNCNVPSERVATIQKALALLPEVDVDQLIVEERLRADGTPEFETVRDDLARLNITRSLKDGKAAKPDDLQKIEKLAQQKNAGEDALLLGWYFLEQKEFQTAESWFRQATARSDTEEAAQGLGLALLGLDEPIEAEKVLNPWWQASARSQANYLASASAILAREPRAKIDEDTFRTIVLAVTRAKDGKAARQIGWYAYENDQAETASQWFQVALTWEPDDEAAAYGLALSLRKSGDQKQLSALIATWSARSKKIDALEPTARRTSAGPSKVGSVTAGSDCTRFVPPSALSPASAVARGWCLLDKNRPIEAVDVFAVALSSKNERTRSDAAYGQSLAYLRLGLVNQASVSATQASQSPERTRELTLDILSKRAGAAFEAGRYTEALIALDERRRYEPEQFDLMVLRGYAYLQLKRYEDALQVFEALASAGYSKGKRGISDTLALRDAKKKNSTSN